MKQQTAVEWLMNEIYRMNRKVSVVDLIEQAKEMEKKQIIKARLSIDQSIHIEDALESAEQYYNKTFKSE